MTPRNAKCPCGSNRKYKHCCESLGLHGSTPAEQAAYEKLLADRAAKAAEYRAKNGGRGVQSAMLPAMALVMAFGMGGRQR